MVEAKNRKNENKLHVHYYSVIVEVALFHNFLRGATFIVI
jgi:hypothetical protein